AKKHFLDFLNDQGSHARLREPYWVDREFNEYILLRFKQYVDDLDLSSGHTNTLLSSTRKALLTAINNRWIQQTHFVDFVLSPSSRETDARAPYSSAETASILSALRKEI